MNDEFVGKVVSVKIRNGAIFNGVLAAVGASWVILKYIPADYIVDGLVLVSTKYILNVGVSDDDLFKEKILQLKNVDFSTSAGLNLDVQEQLFAELKIQDDLIRIELKDHDKNYVGKITVVREKSMKVQLIDTRCNKLSEETFLYNELRAIYFHDDYLQSLKLYSDSKANSPG